MKISAVLADVGRPIPPGSAVNLLNAGWTFTTAMPLEDGLTLPDQTLAVFIEAPWDQLNRPYPIKIELVDDEGNAAQIQSPEGLVPLLIEQEISVPSVPGAPNGTPGITTFLISLGAGTIRIGAPRRRYVWRVTIAEDIGEVGFWVQAPVQMPRIGGVS